MLCQIYKIETRWRRFTHLSHIFYNGKFELLDLSFVEGKLGKTLALIGRVLSRTETPCYWSSISGFPITSRVRKSFETDILEYDKTFRLIEISHVETFSVLYKYPKIKIH